MTAVYLYPRISLEDARGLYESRRSMTLSEIAASWELEHPNQTYAATGGTRVDRETLEFIRSKVLELAIAHGYPEELTLKARSGFDAECAALLNDQMSIIPSDAGSAEVWLFFANVLCPEVPPWRWPSRNERRFLDHQRNTFRSLYWRGYVLEPLRLAQFGEDELVAIVERPSLSANPDVARQILDTFAEVRGLTVDRSAMEVMRDYAKRLRRFVAFVSFDALSKAQRQHLFREVLGDTLVALGELDAAKAIAVADRADHLDTMDGQQGDFGVGRRAEAVRRQR